MTKNNENKIGSATLLISFFSMFVLLPYIIYRSNMDMHSLNNHGVVSSCKVLSIGGLKRRNIEIEYIIAYQRFTKVVSAPSKAKVYVGDILNIKYDTTNYHNFMVKWVLEE